MRNTDPLCSHVSTRSPEMCAARIADADNPPAKKEPTRSYAHEGGRVVPHAGRSHAQLTLAMP